MKKILLIFSITICAFILRIWDLHKLPLDIDWDTTVTFYSLLYNQSGYFWDRPLEVMLFSLFSRLVGINRYCVLLPAVGLGLLSLIPVYYLARRFFSRQVALLTLLLVSISAWHILFSRTGYLSVTASGFLCAILILFFYLGLLVSRRYFLLFGVFLGLAFLNFYPVVLPVLFFFALGLTVVQRGYRKLISRYFLLAVLLSILIYGGGNALFALSYNKPLLTGFLAQKSQLCWRSGEQTLAGRCSLDFIWQNVLAFFRLLFYRMPADPCLGIFRIFHRPLLDPYLSILFILSFFYHLRYFRKNIGVQIMVLWFFAGLVTFSLFVKPEERYLYVILPVPYIMAAALLVKLLSRLPDRFLRRIIFICFLICFFSYNWIDYFVVYRDTYSGEVSTGQKEIFYYLREHYCPGEVILVSNIEPRTNTYSAFYTYPFRWTVKNLAEFKSVEVLRRFEEEQISKGKRVLYVFEYARWYCWEGFTTFHRAHPFIKPVYVVEPGAQGYRHALYEIPQQVDLPQNGIVVFSGEEGDYLATFAVSENTLAVEKKEDVGWQERFICFAKGVRGWQIEEVNTSYSLRQSDLGFLALDAVFDGAAAEDELVRINKEIDIDLGRYGYFKMIYKVDDPQVQTIEMILDLDIDGDNKGDCQLRQFTNPASVVLTSYYWPVLEILQAKFPQARVYRALKLELYFHKFWGRDCSLPGTARKYQFQLGEVSFVSVTDQLAFPRTVKSFSFHDPEEINQWQVMEKEFSMERNGGNIRQAKIARELDDLPLKDNSLLRVELAEEKLYNEEISVFLQLESKGQEQDRIILLDTFNCKAAPEDTINYRLGELIKVGWPDISKFKVKKLILSTRQEVAAENKFNFIFSLTGGINKIVFSEQLPISSWSPVEICLNHKQIGWQTRWHTTDYCAGVEFYSAVLPLRKGDLFAVSCSPGDVSSIVNNRIMLVTEDDFNRPIRIQKIDK